MSLKEQISLLKLKVKERANALSESSSTNEKTASNSKGSNSFIKYKELIKESLKHNKDIPLYKKFKLESNEEKLIQVNRNSSNDINKQDLPLPIISLSEAFTQNQDEINHSKTDDDYANNNNNKQQESQKEEKQEPLPKKEYKIAINPSEIIREIKEQDSTQRVIDVDKYSYDFKCNELYNWFHLTFIEWEKELEEVLISDPELAKSRMGIYKQCRGYIKTLLIHLKEKTVTKVILDKLFQVMVFSRDGDYIRAHDNYIELSIGNAPWPMGVTMVGIHERSGRSKIYTSQVAYILNDDITKKYLQSVKRIMTFIQRRYPKSPSKCVFS